MVTGSCAGGGYELALAADHIILTDDGSSTVALPELPLLAVLPGTGGLTRVTDKRKVRRDHADVFCTTEEGIKGRRAVEWRLVDEVVPNSKLEDVVRERARQLAAKSDRPADAKGIALAPLERRRGSDGVDYGAMSVEFARADRLATITLARTRGAAAGDDRRLVGAGLAPSGRSSSRASSTMRSSISAPTSSTWRRSCSNHPARAKRCSPTMPSSMPTATTGSCAKSGLLWKRVLKRVDLTSRTLVALIEPGSCFAGTLAELAFASDRSYMLIGQHDGDNRPPAAVALAAVNFGAYPMSNGLSRLASRFLGEPQSLEAARAAIGQSLDAEAAQQLGLVTFALDDIDWEDEIRLFLEERASFSADGLTGMEANLRFGGPETMESKIFARLTAWQNWIFQRPNAVGEEGALRRYGTGQKAVFDTKRV